MAPEDVHHPSRDLRVPFKVRPNVGGTRTETVGLGDRHPRLETRFPRIIGARDHDAPPVSTFRVSTHDERLACESRIVSHLDRSVERVEVDVKDDSRQVWCLSPPRNPSWPVWLPTCCRSSPALSSRGGV